jgi:cell division protein FtsL
MISRTGHLGAFFFERSKRGSVRMVIIVLFVIALLILYVAGKVSIVRLGYRIEGLEREKKELERANRSLRIEASSLSSPARIEEIAVNRLGMIRPPKENIVTVKRKGEPGR